MVRKHQIMVKYFLAVWTLLVFKFTAVKRLNYVKRSMSAPVKKAKGKLLT